VKIGKSKEELDREFETVVTEHERMIYHTALSFLHNEEDAKDATQTVFLKAYRAWHSFRHASSPATWLYSICKNTCNDIWRQKNGGFDLPLSVLEESNLSPADRSETTEETVLRHEARIAVWDAINLLSPPMREALILRDIEGYSYALIAQMTDTDEGTVKSRLHRARASLTKILKDGNYFAPEPSNTEKEGM